jgi:hypothetical protein
VLKHELRPASNLLWHHSLVDLLTPDQGFFENRMKEISKKRQTLTILYYAKVVSPESPAAIQNREMNRVGCM